MSSTSRLSRFSKQGFLAIACLVGYWAIAHGFADFYPISPLGMFRDQMTTASRLVVRPVGGEPVEIGHFVDWHCSEPLDFSNEAHPDCDWRGFSAYDSIAADYIMSHQGAPASGQPVEIVRRRFDITERFGPVQVTDCALMACTARPVSGLWTPRL